MPHVESEVGALQRVAEVDDAVDDDHCGGRERDRGVEGVHPAVLLVVDQFLDWQLAGLVQLDPHAQAAEGRDVYDEETGENAREHSKEHYVREPCRQPALPSKPVSRIQ